jgi:hypothetical protein
MNIFKVKNTVTENMGHRFVSSSEMNIWFSDLKVCCYMFNDNNNNNNNKCV